MDNEIRELFYDKMTGVANIQREGIGRKTVLIVYTKITEN